MMVQGNKIRSAGARGRKTSPLRRPFIVGALAVGTITLGTSAAVALGTPDGQPPLPLIISAELSMPAHTGMDMMGGADMRMPGHTGMDMMGGSDLSADTHMKGGAPMKDSTDLNIGDHMGTANTVAKAVDAGTCPMSSSDSNMNGHKGKGMPGHRAAFNGVLGG